MKLTQNFNLEEFACHDGTPVPDRLMDNVKELAENLQVIRNEIQEPIYIHSGYRTPKHNTAVGGAKLSQHLTAKAADIIVKTISLKELFYLIEKLIDEGKIKQGGLSLYDTFIHYDIRGTAARW